METWLVGLKIQHVPAFKVASDDTEDTKRLGTRGMADVGAVRLAAGVALLRLARCHDTRIPPATYCLLALTMQARLAYVSPVDGAGLP